MMIKLQIENYYITPPEQNQLQHEDEIALIINRRGTSISHLYTQGAIWLGNLLVTWGSRLRERDGKWCAANTSENPSQC